MFVSSMKILKINTNNISPITSNDSETESVDKVVSRAINGPSNSSSKTNKRDQKLNSSKTKFTYGNGNKMQQHITQQHQQTQKYHHKNNNSNNNGNKLKHHHYSNNNNSNNNTSTSMNRKKYFQQQQQQHQHFQPQQQYLSVLQKSTNCSQTATTITNNNSNLIKNQNYSNTATHEQQMQHQSQSNDVKILEYLSSETCTCLVEQNNCDKFSSLSISSDCSSAATSSLSKHTTTSTSSACITCWKSFTKLPQQLATSTKIETNNVQNNVANSLTSHCDINENLAKTTISSSYSLSSSTSSSSTYTGSQSGISSNTTSSTVPKKKSVWINTNTSGENILVVGKESKSNLSSGYFSTQPSKLSKEKQYYESNKDLNTNASENLEKSANQNCNGQKYSTKVDASTDPSQQTHFSKLQIQTADSTAMITTSLPASSSSSTLTKTSFLTKANNNTLTLKTSSQSPKPKQETSDKLNDTKQMLKIIPNIKNNSSDIKITTATNSTSSSSSATSPQNSYSLDFLHSVGVKMTGVAIRTPVAQGSTNTYTNQTATNSPAQNAYPATSTNQRQPRNMYGGSNNNSGNNGTLNYHHHHHQPSQLTIASFIHKDLLGEDKTPSNSNSTSSSRGNSSSSNSKNINNYHDQQQHHYTQHQQQTSSRYHQNYNIASYQQQPAVIQHTNYGGGGYGHRSSGYGYTNYHHTSGEHGMVKTNSMNQLHSRSLKNHIPNFKNSVGSSLANKKSFASSINSIGYSSSSLSSSKSFSSNSSNISNRQVQTVINHDSSNSSTNLNLAIETLPSKTLNGGNQRGNHRGHHNNHHGHHHGNQHSMINSPNVLQHQNYYNLTYVMTDASAGGVSTSRGCSPAPQPLPPIPSPAATCNSPKSLDQSPCQPAMVMNLNASQLQYSRYQQAQLLAVQQQQQFHQFQQQQQANLLNKKMLVPLSLNLPSQSPSPTLTSNSQQPPMMHNIICCSQLDEASTAAAAAAANSSSSSSGIVAVNGYDSDNSSHSSTQIKYTSIKTSKSSISSTSSSSSASSISMQPTQMQQRSFVQTATASTCTPSTPLHSPLDYNYSGTAIILPNQQVPPESVQFYGTGGGGVISVLNVQTKTQNTVSEEDLLQQQQLCLSTKQRSPEPFNISLSNHSNNCSGYWSPSFQNTQFIYHQLSSTQTALVPPIASSSSSCGSSSASISPRLPNDDMQHQAHQRLQNSGVFVTDMSPSSCSSPLNEQPPNSINANSLNLDFGVTLASSSSSSSSSVSGCSNNGSSTSINSIIGGQNSKRCSSQLLVQQKHRFPTQQTCQSSSSSTSSMSNSSATTLSSVVRPRNGNAGENGIYTNNGLTPSQTSIGSLVGSSISGSQHMPPAATQHFYTHHHHSLPPPLPPHNLLFNNPQAHHIRALSALGSSSVHDFFTHTPPDRFLARAHLIEAKEAPATLLNDSKWDQLSLCIWKKFINSQQTEETFKQKMRLWRYLYVFIKNAYPRYGLYLVGSTISGFGSDSSDVDMCLVSRSASTIDPRLEALFNLNVLRDCLSKSGQFENFNLIEAKVPILRFSDRVHQLEVDLNFNNCVGIKNTHLLYCYSQLDWRLRPLVLVTKLWAQYHNINNAKNMTISSYSLVLMVIHFLQYAANPPVLPCLHDIFPEKFTLLRSNDFGYVDMNETMGPYESKNTQTIGELFLSFLEYYSFFDYAQFAISVRTGGLIPVNVCRVAKSIKNDIHQWKELCIEEPFDLTNTARSVYDYETFERVKAVFVASWRTLQETLDLNSVFSTILLPPPCSTENSNIQRNINSSVITTSFDEIESSNEVCDTKVKYEQYVKELANSSPVDSVYEENDFSSLGYDNEANIVNINGDYSNNAESSVTATNSIVNNSTTTCKMRKCKDLSQSLTPLQVQIFDEKEYSFSPSSTTSSISKKTSTKRIINGNNTSNNRTVSAMVS